MLFGLNRLSVVAVAMSDCLEVCSHCRHDFRVRASYDIRFYFYWAGDYYLIDTVLYFEGSRLCHVLHRRVYGVKSGSAFSWLVGIVSFLPFAGSFVVGFLLGFKLG